MRRVVGAVLALVLAVAGPIGRSWAAGPYDGVYAGTGNLLTGRRCTHPQSPEYRVRDSRISHPFGQARVEAMVGPDGKLTNGPDAIRTTTTGAIVGKTLSMDIVTPDCSFHYELTRRE